MKYSFSFPANPHQKHIFLNIVQKDHVSQNWGAEVIWEIPESKTNIC